jgi:hypothetical protein
MRADEDRNSLFTSAAGRIADIELTRRRHRRTGRHWRRNGQCRSFTSSLAVHSLSLVSLRQGGDLRSRHGRIDDGCSAETVIGGSKKGSHVVAEQQDVGGMSTVGDCERGAGSGNRGGDVYRCEIDVAQVSVNWAVCNRTTRQPTGPIEASQPKNTLVFADAQLVEDGFRIKMAALGEEQPGEPRRPPKNRILQPQIPRNLF